MKIEVYLVEIIKSRESLLYCSFFPLDNLHFELLFFTQDIQWFSLKEISAYMDMVAPKVIMRVLSV